MNAAAPSPDARSGPPPSPPSGRKPVHPFLWLMIAVMVGFEATFAAADAGLVPEHLGRWPIFVRLAFFDTIFELALSGEQIYLEAIWSPLTHAFLHGGWLHLALNGAAFLGLGNALVQAIGIGRFLVIFVVTAVAGALTFGLIADSDLPMVGASGAIFGFLAVITAWQERVLRLMRRSRAMIWKRIIGLVILNVLLYLGLEGLVAWEAHLGGWVAGWLLALVFRPRSGPLQVF